MDLITHHVLQPLIEHWTYKYARFHLFTTETLEQLLDAEKLVFCGFMLPKSIKDAYQNCFPEDTNGNSLSNWGEFESNNPSTFQSMYQFWAYKPL